MIVKSISIDVIAQNVSDILIRGALVTIAYADSNFNRDRIDVLFKEDWIMTSGNLINLTSSRGPWPSMAPHDDVINWKFFPRNWPFVRGIHRSPVNSPHKGQ